MSTVHETKAALIEITMKLIRERGLQNVNSDLVLEVSGISKGSLYHHFEDFPQLIEYAYVEIFREMVTRALGLLSHAAATSSTKQEFLNQIRLITHGNSGAEIAAARLARIEALALATSRPRMQALLGEAQSEFNQGLIEIFEAVKARGWVNPNLDPAVVAVFIQAYTFGAIIGELSTHRLNPIEWIHLVDQLLTKVILNGWSD